MSLVKDSPKPKTGSYNARGASVDSKQGLAERYLPLVKSIVAKMRLHLPPSIDVEDIYGIGVYGLMSALEHYDPNKGSAFGAYAALRIRGAILDELRKLDWMPRKLRAQAKQWHQQRQELEQRLGREPTGEEMSEALGLEHKLYQQLEEQMRPITVLNLDQLFSEDQGSGSNSLHEVIDDRTEINSREYAEDRERLHLIKDAIQELPDMSRKVLAMYYFEDLRLAEIAAVFDLSESRICQIHSKALGQMRDILQRLDT